MLGFVGPLEDGQGLVQTWLVGRWYCTLILNQGQERKLRPISADLGEEFSPDEARHVFEKGSHNSRLEGLGGREEQLEEQL